MATFNTFHDIGSEALTTLGRGPLRPVLIIRLHGMAQPSSTWLSSRSSSLRADSVMIVPGPKIAEAPFA